MTKLIFLLLLLPIIGQAHPGVGIVKDSKGNIYYTDLTHVWKITNGKKTVAVPNVHTHELYVDRNDNLFGEGGYYNNQTSKFYHYLWVRRPTGKVDTVMGLKEAYVRQDFSLARDENGNEYYLKRFLAPHKDTMRLYRKTPNRKETIFATGNFKRVNWLHPQPDGNLLYVSGNAIYKVDSLGTIKLVKESVGNAKPSFKFSGNSVMVWGLWQDQAKNIYAAVFSDQTIKKIDTAGTITDVYKSSENWTPLHGVFDKDKQLWVLEGSDKNDVRVVLAETTFSTPGQTTKTKSNKVIYIVLSVIVLGAVLLYFRFKAQKK